MAHIRTLAIAVLCAALACSAHAQQTISYSADGTAFTHPARIPQKVLALVMRDKTVFPKGAPNDLDCVSRERTTQPPKPQLLCAQLQISPMPGVNYIILGAGSLYADHLAPFWIIHYEDDAGTVLFRTHAATLRFLPARHDGYNDLEVSGIAAEKAGKAGTALYRFDLGSYQQLPDTPPPAQGQQPEPRPQ